jgi:hypothetical protein
MRKSLKHLPRLPFPGEDMRRKKLTGNLRRQELLFHIRDFFRSLLIRMDDEIPEGTPPRQDSK